MQDQMAQEDALSVIEPIFKSVFCGLPNGFRPWRSANAVVEKLGTLKKIGGRRVEDLDTPGSAHGVCTQPDYTF